MKKIQIGVIGPDKTEYPKNKNKRNKMIKVAQKIGELIALNNWILFTGGTEGIMLEASKGAKRKRGLVVGIPGNVRNSANRYIDVEIVTNINIGSFNCAGLLSSDIIIVIPGGAGTLAELSIAYRYKKPIIILKGFNKFYDNLINKYLDNGQNIKFMGATNELDVITLIKKQLK